MADIELFRDDKLFNLSFTVKDVNNAAVNLTNSTIKFKMAAVGESTTKISAGCSIPDAANGQYTYTVQAGDLDTLGTYHAELEITYSGGKIITAGMDEIKVVKDLP